MARLWNMAVGDGSMAIASCSLACNNSLSSNTVTYAATWMPCLVAIRFALKHFFAYSERVSSFESDSPRFALKHFFVDSARV